MNSLKEPQSTMAATEGETPKTSLEKQSILPQNSSVQVCTRCIVDTTVPAVKFDENGECNFCKLHDKLERLHPLTPEGQKRFEGLLNRIKSVGKNRQYDCVVGVSGGRDSSYTLYMCKQWGLRALAVHFNDGFGNPIAGENMRKATKKLGFDLITITSDWRESKDLRIAFLKASTPDLQEGADLGIATALYGICAKKNIKYLLIGQSFRTEGVGPLTWNYLDGKYLRSVHKMFGSHPLRKWKADDPGFNLDLSHLFYYTILLRIRTIPVLYYVHYVRKNVDEILKSELDWIPPGVHFFDDLYQSITSYVLRVKFNIDRRKIHYSAQIRSGQLDREEALKRTKEVYALEDPKIIDLCIKRLGLTKQQFDEFMALPPKTFRDYPTNYNVIRKLKIPIKIASRLHLIPTTAYEKYFKYV